MSAPIFQRRIIKVGFIAAGLCAASIPAVRPVSAQEGFFFNPPQVSFEFRMGRTAQSTNSDVYDDLTSRLTLNRHDFSATSYAATAAFRASPQVDVVVGLGYAKSNTASESRDFIGTDDLPIAQRTELVRVPITAGVRFYPLTRGHAFGRYAWVPASFTPYLGAGAGLMHYRLSQSGDFVQEEDLTIFTDDLESKATSPMAYGEAGAAFWMSGHVGLTGDVRYMLSKSPMNGDFRNFNDIDLRGVQGSAGLVVRF